jgi:hypothetical protein
MLTIAPTLSPFPDFLIVNVCGFKAALLEIVTVPEVL